MINSGSSPIFINQPGLVAHTCHPGTWELELGESAVQDYPEIYGILSKYINNKLAQDLGKIVEGTLCRKWFLKCGSFSLKTHTCFFLGHLPSLGLQKTWTVHKQ